MLSLYVLQVQDANALQQLQAAVGQDVHAYHASDASAPRPEPIVANVEALSRAVSATWGALQLQVVCCVGWVAWEA